MSDSEGLKARDLFRRRRGETQEAADAGEMLAQITRAIDDDFNVDLVHALMGRYRHAVNDEQSAGLDLQLLRRLHGYRLNLAEIGLAHRKLERHLERLLSPPLFPGRYLEVVTTSDGELAKVAQAGATRVVAFGADVDVAELAAGDEVYLCHERNAIVALAPRGGTVTGETAVMARRIEDGRLVVADRDTEVIVAASAALAGEKLKPGDKLLWDRSCGIALSRVAAADEHGYTDYDDTPPPRLAGLDDDCRAVLDRFVFSILHPDLARAYGVDDNSSRRLLLIGPPGTGKTSLMRIVVSLIAKATGKRCRVVIVSGAELYSSYVGETERNIRRVFTILNDYDGPAIAFFDEIDAIGRLRGNPSGYHDDRQLGTLLAGFEGMQPSKAGIIAATNRADALDPALRSRFASELEMPRPDMSAAREIFRVHLPADLPYRPNGADAPLTREALIEAGVARLYEPNADNQIASVQFRDGTRREVAARELVSGRLIEQTCKAARAAAFERACRGGEAGLQVEDMEVASAAAIARLRGTLSRRNVASYLADLPEDNDDVAVRASRAGIDSGRYLR